MTSDTGIFQASFCLSGFYYKTFEFQNGRKFLTATKFDLCVQDMANFTTKESSLGFCAVHLTYSLTSLIPRTCTPRSLKLISVELFFFCTFCLFFDVIFTLCVGYVVKETELPRPYCHARCQNINQLGTIPKQTMLKHHVPNKCAFRTADNTAL